MSRRTVDRVAKRARRLAKSQQRQADLAMVRDAFSTLRGTRSPRSLADYPGPGERNGWLCDTCQRLTIGVHRDHGVTPMFLACRATPGCHGRARSLMYQGVPDGPADIEWYRPERDEITGLPRPMFEHVELGGLVLRPIPKETP